MTSTCMALDTSKNTFGAQEMLSGLSDEELSKLQLDRTERYLMLSGVEARKL